MLIFGKRQKRNKNISINVQPLSPLPPHTHFFSDLRLFLFVWFPFFYLKHWEGKSAVDNFKWKTGVAYFVLFKNVLSNQICFQVGCLQVPFNFTQIWKFVSIDSKISMLGNSDLVQLLSVAIVCSQDVLGKECWCPHSRNRPEASALNLEQSF